MGLEEKELQRSGRHALTNGKRYTRKSGILEPGRSHPSPILNPYILGPEHNDITCLLLVGIRNDCSAPKNYTAKHKEQWSDSFWGIHKLIFSFFFLSNVTTIHDVICQNHQFDKSILIGGFEDRKN